MNRISHLVFLVIMIGIMSGTRADDSPKFTGRTHPLQAMRALPAVFQIYMVGDVEIRPPKSIELRINDLDEQFRQAQASGDLPPDMTAKVFKWISVAMEPEKYLQSREGDDVIRLKNRHVGSGSGFAISRDGIVLTNRHVVEDQENKPLDPKNLSDLNPACLTQLRDDLRQSLGAWEGDPGLGALVETQILAWLGERCRMTAHFDRAIVAIAYADPKVSLPDAAEVATGQFGLAGDRREPILVPATILSKGAEGFPTDVAILKIDINVLDALVCLPLAKPGQARASNRIFSLGFPGYRYDEATMSLAELHMVSVSSGMIHWSPNPQDTSLARRVKARAKDLNEVNQQLLGVTAIIRPGSSGGPLVREDGTVIGLNVAFRENYDPVWNRANVRGLPAPKYLFSPSPAGDNPKSLDMAVPIEVALKMLADLKITPDAGPTTKLWREGMDLYDAGKYAAAQAKFELVATKQVLTPTVGKPYASKKQSIRIVSHYVQEMIDRCRKAVK